MAEEKNIHATCVAIGGKAVLLLGPSGAGKSDVALRLIDGGARLVADDRTILRPRGGKLWAKAPATIRGLLEIRGVGIVRLPRARLCGGAAVALAVKLGTEGTRLPAPSFHRVLNTKVPQIALDGRFASTPAKIRAALAALAGLRSRDTLS